MAPQSGLDTTRITDGARRDLLDLLEGVRGKKNLVLEKSLAGPIGVFVKFSTLQDYGVDKVFLLENGNVDSSQRNVIFIARGDKALQAQTIAAQITRLQKNRQAEHDFSIFWVPRRTLVSEKILEDAGVLGDVTTGEFPLHFLPLEPDLLSLELDDSFSDLYLRKDPTAIFLSAKALMLLQLRHGLFPRITGKGDNAKRLADLLIRMRSEVAAGEDSAQRTTSSILGLTPSATIDSLIIIDREVDFATPLLTQLTYEGLIDEHITIRNNSAEVDSSIIGPSPAQAASSISSTTTAPPPSTPLKRKIPLDSSDVLYSTLRHQNFSTIGPSLNKLARRLEADLSARHTAKSTAELRTFVTKLPAYQAEQSSLKIHTNLAEHIMQYTQSPTFTRSLDVQHNLVGGADPSTIHDDIEELISRDAPLPTVLRLLCLESCIAGGLAPRDLETFSRAILHAYGFQHLLTLSALSTMGLLQSRSSTGPLRFTGRSSTVASGPSGATATASLTKYTTVRRALSLIVDSARGEEANDIAYVYSGYAPLSVRLVQCVVQKNYLLGLTNGTSTQSGGGTDSSNTGSAPTTISTTTTTGAAQGWRAFEEILKNVRGKTFDEVQRGDDKAVRARMILNGHNERKTVIVFFLGGITFAEIAALKWVANREEGRRQFIICTTSIISGGRMMDAAMEKRGFGAS